MRQGLPDQRHQHIQTGGQELLLLCPKGVRKYLKLDTPQPIEKDQRDRIGSVVAQRSAEEGGAQGKREQAQPADRRQPEEDHSKR